MTLLFIYVALALGFSFLCSVMEAVLLCVTPSYVARTESTNPRLGKRLKVLRDDVDRPLAAILSLNTIAHTMGAYGAGKQAGVVWGEQNWVVLGYSLPIVEVFAAVLTLFILVLSEIIPKTLGAVYWRQLSSPVVTLLTITMWSMWPLVWMSQGLTKILAPGKKQILISREELTALAELGTQEGVVREEESRILRNLFRLEKVLVRDIMTPRTVVFALPATMTAAEALAGNERFRFSRLPIYGENHDDILGFVLTSDLLLHAAGEDGNTPLAELKRPLDAVPRDLPLRDLFDRLMDNRAHIALVVDEYGGTSGIVTMEDLLETLLGLEIVDEGDAVQDMQELARQKWRERAARLGLAIDDDES